MSKDFSGKVVLVTGSSSGIGEAIAVLFSKLGAHVVVSGLFRDDVSRVANSCQSISPKKLKPLEVVADITVDEEAKNLIESTIREFDKIDILVNNAGSGWLTDIKDINFMEKYEKTMQLNLRSVVYLSHLAVPHLEKTKGNIVNISSIGAYKKLPMLLPYCMSKSALTMFAKFLATDLGANGVRVNNVSPGVVNTQLYRTIGWTENIIDEAMSDSAKSSALGILPVPVDIANAVVFLASDEASLITGTNMVVDGGILSFS